MNTDLKTDLSQRGQMKPTFQGGNYSMNIKLFKMNKLRTKFILI